MQIKVRMDTNRDYSRLPLCHTWQVRVTQPTAPKHSLIHFQLYSLNGKRLYLGDSCQECILVIWCHFPVISHLLFYRIFLQTHQLVNFPWLFVLLFNSLCHDWDIKHIIILSPRSVISVTFDFTIAANILGHLIS